VEEGFWRQRGNTWRGKKGENQGCEKGGGLPVFWGVLKDRKTVGAQRGKTRVEKRVNRNGFQPFKDLRGACRKGGEELGKDLREGVWKDRAGGDNEVGCECWEEAVFIQKESF